MDDAIRVVRKELAEYERQRSVLVLKLQTVKAQIQVSDEMGGLLYSKLLDTVQEHFDEFLHPLNCKINALNAVLDKLG